MVAVNKMVVMSMKRHLGEHSFVILLLIIVNSLVVKSSYLVTELAIKSWLESIARTFTDCNCSNIGSYTMYVCRRDWSSTDDSVVWQSQDVKEEVIISVTSLRTAVL